MPSTERLPSSVIRNLGSMKPGKYCDGRGLWLVRRKDGRGQWVYRFQLAGVSREMGLGSCDDISLAQARTDAARWRGVVKSGRDPIKQREDERKAAMEVRPTFAEVFEACFEARKGDLKDDGKAGRWDSPIRVHVLPVLGKTPVEDIDQRDVKRALAGIWNEKPNAAVKALNRIGLTLDHAVAMGLNVDTAAARNARTLLGAQRHKTQNVPSLDWREVPVFASSLGDTVGEQALRLLMLTALRPGEVRGAHVSEFDIAARTWTIPPERMKMARPHRVPLSDEALAVVEARFPLATNGLLFAGSKGKPISDMTMTQVMRRRDMDARPHGFRSSFRVWAAEVATDFPREVCEAVLAHKTADKSEAAYQRSDFLERRRALMAKWADHVAGRSGEVVKLANG